MSELKVWTNGTDTVVARDLDGVQAIVEAHHGSTFEAEGWSRDDWWQVDGCDPITICNINDGGSDDKLTLTAGEWIAREGACFLCSTEW